MVDLGDSRVLVTGGNGFLGARVVARFKDEGAKEVLAPRSSEYDLRQPDAVRWMLKDLEPDVVVHLAAVVGGIGANRLSPGAFFYENAVMGIHLIEESRLSGVKK